VKEAYRELEPEDYFQMGFETVPNYELLRVFIYEKIKREQLATVFQLIIKEIMQLLRRHGIRLGRRVGEDATDIPALKHDSEATYSDYYKESGYKVDIVHDLDQETLPLQYSTLSLIGDEGKCLCHAYDELRAHGMLPNEWKVDGKYPTYENIAYLETESSQLIYKIQDAWVFNPKGTVKAIQRRYQRYHKRKDFKITRDMDVMLEYLLHRGDIEWVGAYYRNHAIEAYNADPDLYLDVYHERSGKTEGFMSTVKTQTVLGSRLPRRGWKAFQFAVDLSMLAFAFAALIRVQNNDTTRLGNLTFIS
jgi:hypothetical protein